MLIYKLVEPVIYNKYLLLQLTQKEIKARYKQSIIGILWVIVNPLVQLIVYSFVFSIVFRFPTGDVPYPLFLFAALLPWTFLQNSISSATNSLVDHAPLLKKVVFPREAIPYSVVLAKLVDFFIAALVFVGIFLIFGQPFRLSMLLVFPILVIQIVLVLGVSLLMSAFNLFYRDIQHLTGLLLMVWMYLTPVVYSMALVPDQFIWLYKLNPMVGIIEAYRAVIFGFPLEAKLLMWSLILSLAIFLFAFFVFKKLERVFADIV